MAAAWFDVASRSDRDIEEEEEELSAVQSINEVVTAEVDAGIPSDRVVLGGFSQGGALGLLTGSTAEFKLAGIFTLSVWLPRRQKMKDARSFSRIVRSPLYHGVLRSWLATRGTYRFSGLTGETTDPVV